jgi:hypothetical protein
MTDTIRQQRITARRLLKRLGEAVAEMRDIPSGCFHNDPSLHPGVSCLNCPECTYKKRREKAFDKYADAQVALESYAREQFGW